MRNLRPLMVLVLLGTAGAGPLGAQGPASGNPYTDALVKIGAASLPALEKALQSGNEATRWAVVIAMSRLGSDGIPYLLRALDDDRPGDVRRRAAQALTDRSALADDRVLPRLLQLLKEDRDVHVRYVVLVGLTHRNEALPVIQDALCDVGLSEHALAALKSLRVDPMPGLKKALAHRDARVRVHAAGLMMTNSLDPDLAEPVLLAGLRDADLAVRWQAAHGLVVGRRQAVATLPILTEALKDLSPAARLLALQDLQRLGKIASPTAAQVVELVNDKDGKVGQQAVYTLKDIDPDLKKIAPCLIRLLTHRDVYPRNQAIWAFQSLGDLRAIREDLQPVLKEGDLHARAFALSFFGQMGEAGVPELIAGLEDKEATMRQFAAEALQQSGLAGLKAIPALRNCVTDPDDQVRKKSVVALIKMGPDGLNALAKSFSKTPDKLFILSALDKDGIGPRPLVPHLLRCLDDSDARLRASAARILGRVGTPAAKAAPRLRELLKDADPQVRTEAENALMRIVRKKGKSAG